MLDITESIIRDCYSTIEAVLQQEHQKDPTAKFEIQHSTYDPFQIKILKNGKCIKVIKIDLNKV